MADIEQQRDSVGGLFIDVVAAASAILDDVRFDNHVSKARYRALRAAVSAFTELAYFTSPRNGIGIPVREDPAPSEDAPNDD